MAGYLTIDQCGNPVNQLVTWLSILHIVFQPLLMNVFMLELLPADVRARWRWPAMLLAGCASTFILLQLAPLPWAGSCLPGASLRGAPLCTVTGTWHLAWDVPYNGLATRMVALWGNIGSFPAYPLAVFVLPLLYGAWRFAIFHALMGPIAASMLTDDPNEVPAIWCLFSIGILLAALSPQVWRVFSGEPAAA